MLFVFFELCTEVPQGAAPSASPAFDLAQARSDWRAACAKYGAAEKHYLEMCLNPPEPMPERDAVRSKRLEEIYEQEDKLGEVTDSDATSPPT